MKHARKNTYNYILANIASKNFTQIKNIRGFMQLGYI